MHIKTSPTKPNYQRVFLISLSLALVIIIVGSILAITGKVPSFADLGNQFSGALEKITNSNLIVKTDRTRLAANKISQTIITAYHPKPSTPFTARIVRGTGTITKTSETETEAKFTYTSGDIVGTVEIIVKVGTVEESIELQLLEPIAPPAPQLFSPPTNSNTNLLKPEIVGTGPANTKITISNNGQVNVSTQTDKLGAFRVRLERALVNGQQIITAVSISDLDIASPPSNQLIINVQAEPLKYDSANIRYSPTQIVAGRSFAVFVPVSLNTERVEVELNGATFELKDSNGVSIFSRSLPAPEQPGSYSANLILFDAGGAPTRFDNALRFSVVANE